MKQIIFHIDVNNAFLSWTAVDYLKKGSKIDIRTIPSVIGGDENHRRGIVLAKSTPAKKLGIITPETLYSARKKVQGLKVFPPDYKLYNQMSTKFFNLLEKYIPYVEKASVDEGYFNYTEIKSIYKDEVAFAHKLKDEIKNTLGFTVNIGIANTKICAKMASDFTKPDRVHTLYENEISKKLWPLPVEKLFTVGKQMSFKLRALGITTIGQLAQADLSFLKKHFKNQGTYLRQIANGIDNSKINTEDRLQKCISHEFTFDEDITSRNKAYEKLELISDMIAKRLRNQLQYTNTICVIIKDNDFKRISHQKKLKTPTNITNEIYWYSKIIFNELWDGRNIRLLGIRLDDLVDNANKQLSLFEEQEKNDENSKIDKIIDEINKKYNYKVINKASLINKDNQK